ncbi:transposase [Paenibacillus sp. Soil787]|uniref:transposase n=1 Tax=Paenibacillus sp. Soil787 TaxID=1736411 RepID=UPI0007032F0A|nr:transposase [Paenibacillus sp. Soil787]KRF20204.1 hypothetical protein ASG93_31335 [Paenibacillus sp. Soil787]
MSELEITTAIGRLTGRDKSTSWCLERVQILAAAARRNPFKEMAFPSHLISLQLLIKLLLQYQEHLATLVKSVDALAEELHDLIQSIPGIGTKIAATILAEIGEIDRLNKKLRA